MFVTVTEPKENLERYLRLPADKDIYIIYGGAVVLKLPNPNRDRADMAKSLFGVLPADVTLEEVRAERLNQI